ncbi:methyl-accepting chemotaxis protein [Brevibacillus migulae]|uniref:methyl-accepting chemotaxis protein n=1 Tax=Brevibacillus migulae TaxID=1644114 RepID=UPI001F23C4D1|nr:methyl-accepting chemotaxis protein [Brevibacillus migulae]
MKLTIKNKLISSFALVLLIPSLAIGGFAYQTAKNKVEEQMMNAASGNVELLKHTIDQFIDPKVKDMTILAQEVKAEDVPETWDKLNRYQAAHPELEVTFVGTDKGLFLNSPKTKMADDYDPRKRAWYQDAMAKKDQVIITSPYVSAMTKNLVITFAKATTDGKGVVAASLTLTELDKIVKKVKIGNEGYVQVLDKNRKWIIHPSAEVGSEFKGETADKIFATDTGEFAYGGSDGTERLMAFDTHPLTGWKISGTLSTDEVAKEAGPIFTNTLIVLVIAVLSGAFLVYLITRSINKPLDMLIGAAERISEGDLTRRIELKTNDELGKLGVSFNKMADSLGLLISEVSHSANQLAASSEQLTASAEQTGKATEHITYTVQEVAQGTEHQMHSVEQSAKAINEMSAGIQLIAANAHSVSSTAVQASESSVEGGQVIQTAIQQMHSISGTVDGLAHVVKELGERSQAIGEIVNVITTVAQQTNLLALNAAIEAARAGEHGRGFAVVADEVRKLAEQSSRSAQQIAELIATIQNETSRAVQSMETATKEVSAGIGVVNTAGESFKQIGRSVSEVTKQIQEVSQSAQQISAGSAQVVQSIDRISEVTASAVSGIQNVSATTEEQLASMEEITSSANALSNMAEELQALVGRFRI